MGRSKLNGTSALRRQPVWLFAGAWTQDAEAAAPKVRWVGAGSNFTRADRPATSIRLGRDPHDRGRVLGSVQWLRNPRARASAHYVVSQRGEIVQLVRDGDIAWHAGNYTINRGSVGIEHEGYAGRAGSVTEAEYRASAQLAAYLARRSLMPIDRKHFIGHADVPDPNNARLKGGFSHHHDPGPHWQWSRYLSLVRTYARGATPPRYVVPAPKRPAAPMPKPVARPKPSTPTQPSVLAVATSWPKSGQRVSGFVPWHAAVTGRDIKRVDFLVDGHLRQTKLRAPFSYSADGSDRWDTTRETNGPHVLTLRVVTTAGRIAGSSTRVVVANTLFQVASGSLANGQSINGRTRWDALVQGGEADRVEYLIDGRLVHSEREAPYTYVWDTKAEQNGPHSLVLRGVSRDGRVAMATLGVTVENVKPPEPPRPSPFRIVSQTLFDGQTVQGVVPWEVQVEGSGVSRVEFVVDGVRRWTDRDNPWLFNGDGRWDASREQPGAHQLVVRAVHRDGRSTSTAVRVVVTRAAAAPLAVGSTLSSGATLLGTTRWEALVTGPAADRVEFSVDGRVRHVERSAPYEFDWAAGRETAGAHVVAIRAVAAGQSAEWTGTVTIGASVPALPPAPALAVEAAGVADGATVEDTVELSASVTGTATKVELLVDGAVVQTERTAPYDFEWDTTHWRDGRHELALRATATDGKTATDELEVTIANDVAPGARGGRPRGRRDRLRRARPGGDGHRSRGAESGGLARRPPHPRHAPRPVRVPSRHGPDPDGSAPAPRPRRPRPRLAAARTPHQRRAAVIACFLCAAAFAVTPVGISSGATLSGEVAFEAQVPGVQIERIELVIDGRLRDTESQAPFRFEWDTPRELDGPHRVELWAVARDGRVSTTAVDVRVTNRFDLRFAAVARQVKGTVRLAAKAVGTPQWVEVHVDGKLRATEQEAPYSVEWDTTEERDGEHRLTLWAVAPNGRVATETRTVVVRNGRAVVTTAAPAATIARLKRETWEWQLLTRTPRTSARGDVAFWRDQAAAARKRASRPPHWRQFLCIHRYEGAWNAKTGNGYFGGLQMNMDFQRAYGPELLARKGTANNWTPLEQIWVAERAVPGRGFNPWPQTARMCGLL